MDEPLTERVLQFVVTLLQGISIASGYYTDIGLGHISTEPTQRPSPDNAYIVVTETEIEVTDSGRRTTNSNMNITIEIVVPCDGAQRQPARMARRARADCVRALKAPPRDFPAGLRSIELDRHQKLSFDDERYANSVVAQLTARAGLSETFPPATP